MAELKPCPFCGGEVKLFIVGAEFGKRTVLRCVNPLCYMSQLSPFTSYHNGDTEEHAEMRLTTAWNRRAEDGATQT